MWLLLVAAVILATAAFTVSVSVVIDRRSTQVAGNLVQEYMYRVFHGNCDSDLSD